MDLQQLYRQTLGINPQVLSWIEEAEEEVRPSFRAAEKIREYNQLKVLSALQQEGVALRHFAPTTGYGYDDIGRDALDRVFARALGTEDALVRPQFASGTHALTTMLFGLLMPGDEMLAATGKPYDTLEEAIGITGNAPGSLKAYGVSYAQVDLLESGNFDREGILKAIGPNTKVLYIQRSRGYAWRKALTIGDIADLIRAVKKEHPQIIVAVDNCYGEFIDLQEPGQVGADVMAGSLIKNPGGGIAPTGGYIAGRSELIERIAQRLTSPGIGREVGSYAASYAPFYQGLFLAPSVVCECVKGTLLCARVFEKLGFKVLPSSAEKREDIIQSICFNDEKMLVAFCQSIQKASPVDSMAVPYPWDMPGYQHQVIMAAGAFVQGSSIELSADAPIKPPYIAYMQGGLTYDHVKIGVACAVQRLAEEGFIRL
jgi:cystathionine beta-lyase family protein involved in aluminum resistance